MRIKLTNLLKLSLVSLLILNSCTENNNNNSNPSSPTINKDLSSTKFETFTDSRDSRVYKYVIIGNQTWMAENLAYAGSDIKHITKDNSEWTSNSDYDGWSYYRNDSKNGDIYGVLYQWGAAKIACPKGWHLPSDSEWTELENFIKNNVSSSLKSLTNWSNNCGGTDNYNFSALPGGRRGIGGGFYKLGYSSFMWSSSEYDSKLAYGRELNCNNSKVYHLDTTNKFWGFSVRCIKD